MTRGNGLDDPEIGRELKGSEIRAGMVVVISPPGQPPGVHIAFTMNVVEVRPGAVVFASPIVNLHVVNMIGEDDLLKDDMGRVVRVFEYLGP